MAQNSEIYGVLQQSHDLTTSNFGLFIAYVLPGFTALKGFPLLSELPGGWGMVGSDSPTFTGFLSGTVEAMAAGLTVSTVRWLVIDSLHRRTGLVPPSLNFGTLEKRAQAFELIITHQYQYYKFYSNMVVALAWAFATGGYALGWRGLLYFPLAGLFFLGSRDTLRKYYDRTRQLLGVEA